MECPELLLLLLLFALLHILGACITATNSFGFNNALRRNPEVPSVQASLSCSGVAIPGPSAQGRCPTIR